MPVIKLNQMGGIYPSTLPRALPNEAAQIAENLNPGTNEFRPFKGDTVVQSGMPVNNPKALYRFDRNPDGTINTSENSGWISDSSRVSVVRQQLNDDTSGKIFYIIETEPNPSTLSCIDANLTSRLAYLPAPTVTPTLSLTQGYLFTSEVKQRELASVNDQAVAMTLARVTPSWVGIENLSAGWVRRSDFVDPASEGYYASLRDVLRIFAVNPLTNELISTYSNMVIGESAWVFDPSLGGFFAELPPGGTLPAWAIGHSKWWCINMRAYAEVYDLNEPGLLADFLTLKKPGTQGAENLLTPAQAQELVDALVAHGDKDGPRVRANIDYLKLKINTIRNIFENGGKASLALFVQNFMAQTRVSTRVAKAKDSFAESIWQRMEMIGLATTPPFYEDRSN